MNGKLKLARMHPDVILPKFAKDGDSCMDLHAYIQEQTWYATRPTPTIKKEISIPPGEVRLVPTGIKCELAPGYEIQIRSRSGFSSKNRTVLANGIGTLDAAYRGEWKVALFNLGPTPVIVNHGDKIAQFRICEAPAFDYEVVDEKDLGASDRGQGGFGSTGQ